MVVGIGHGLLVGDALGVGDLADEHHMGAQVDGIHHGAADHRTGVLGGVGVEEQRRLCGNALELVDVRRALEAKAPNERHVSGLGDHREGEVLRRLHDLGGVVFLVERDGHLQRAARHLQRGVDETRANVLAVVGRHHIEPVRETEQRLCVHGSPLLNLADQTFPSYRPATLPSGSSP